MREQPQRKQKGGTIPPSLQEVDPTALQPPGCNVSQLAKPESDSCENRTPGYQGPGAWISEL